MKGFQTAKSTQLPCIINLLKLIDRHTRWSAKSNRLIIRQLLSTNTTCSMALKPARKNSINLTPKSKFLLSRSYHFIANSEPRMERTASTQAKKMSLSSQSLFLSAQALLLQDPWQRSKNLDAVPISSCWKTLSWWVITWSSEPMKSMTWTQRMASVPANASLIKSNAYAKCSRRTVHHVLTESSSQKLTKFCTRKVVCAT